MHPDRWQRLQELFEGAMALPAGQRTHWLTNACGEDPELRLQAESLILHSEQNTGIGDAVRDAAAQYPKLWEPAPGDRFGPYRILRLLGRGGMGMVFLAERADDQFRKTVAIKLIGSRAMTADTLERFKAERQILASLDHPNIARLLDGGAAPDGSPYVVIEYVDGEPITDYCARRNLSIPERLSLLRKVCSAVQYSHQNLIVHRDLKPGNILVGEDGEPKLLDFGIAKLLDPAAASRTQTAARLMTPDYASPEQVRGEPVTTATDVYALGVLLFELLTGELPHKLPSTEPYALEQAICTAEPARPSTIRRELRGDLENITLMALRKEPGRRYASAEQFSDDLRRHLEGYPVHARQDTWRYRTSKFIHRNKALVGVAAVAAAIVVAFAITMAFQAARIARERDLAALERQKAEQVSAFLTNLFRVADPGRNRGETVTAREILDEGAKRIEAELADQAEVQATMMDTIGMVYRSLGLYDTARTLVDRGLVTRRRLFGDRHADVAISLRNLANVLRELGEFDAALAHAQESLTISRALFGNADPRLFPGLNMTAILLEDKADYEQSERLHREAVALLRKDPHPDLRLMATSLHNLAGVLRRRGKDAEAAPMLTEVLHLRRKVLGNNHPEVMQALNNLGTYRLDQRDLEGAIEAFQEVVALRRSVLGNDHPDLAKALTNLANPLIRQKRLDEALELLNEAANIFRKRLGEDHLNVAFVLESLATVLYWKGDYEAADPLYRRSTEMFRKRFGEDHPEVALGHYNIAGNFQAWEKYDQAEQHARRAEAIQRSSIGADSQKRLKSLVRLADILYDKGNASAAEEAWREALDAGGDTWKTDNEDRAAALAGLGRSLLARNKPSEAEPMLVEALNIQRGIHPAGDVRTAYTESALGDCLTRLGRYAEAEPLLLSGLDKARAEYGDDHARTRSARVLAAKLYEAQGNVTKAASFRR